ncbi:MAG: ABC transporter substrate-binding protein [Dehalococcoidia bacterium]|nr:ABC transporter substrate-binding protein [Dehalococcoidia bacterium]
MKGRAMGKLIQLAALVSILVLAASACTPAATPAAVPTKAAAAASPTTAATVQPTKPAGTPAAGPTTSAASKPAGNTVKIGYITPLTGPAAAFGQMESVMVSLGEDDVNASGAINGSPLQIVRFDSPSDPQQAVTGVRKFAGDENAFAIIGPWFSGEFEVAAPLANDLQIPLIGMRTTKPGMSDNNRPWEFRITVTDDILTPALVAAFKKANPNVKKVLVVGDTKQSVTQSMVADVWPKYLKEAGLAVQDTVGYDSGTTDFSAIITKIKDLKPEAIAYSATPPGNPVGFAKELYNQQVRVPVMNTIHFINGPFVFQAAKEMEGWLTVSQFDPSNPDAKTQDIIKRWQAKVDADPNVPKPARVTVEGNGYDVILILADIMRKAGIKSDTAPKDARAKIRDGFASLKDYKGISGTITMKPNGDATTLPTVMTARNGAWEVVK